MTKGQFALLTAALGLVTMGGAGYFAYASSSPHGTSGNGASANGQPTSGGGGGQLTVPSGEASPSPSPSTGGNAGLGNGSKNCQNGTIQVSQQQGQGAMGTISVVLVFQNTSTSSCVLHGFPGASLAGADGTVLLNATRKLPAGLAKSPEVVLAPGAQATAVLSWSDVANGSGCAVQNAAKLLVTPPNTTLTSPLSFSGSQVCSDFTIRPVLK